MKILQINANDIIGGAAQLGFELHKKLSEKEINNKMLVGYKYSDDKNVYAIYKRNVLNKSYKFILNNLNKYSSQQFRFYPKKRIINNKITREADIIHLHNLHGSYFNLAILPLLAKENKKIVWTLHDMWATTGHCSHAYDCERYKTGCGNCPYLDTYPALRTDNTKNLWRDKEAIYKKTNMTIVTPSKWLKNIVEKSVLKDKDIKLIYNGIDTNIFKPGDKKSIRKKLKLPENHKIIIFIAYMGFANTEKGGNYLKNIVDKIQDKKITILNIGGKNAQTSEKNIINIPYIKDKNILADYYRSADLFVFPTLAENFPLTVLESMACGTPVVSFETGGVPEIIEHKKDGYVAKYKDVNDLYNGTKKILDDDELRKKMSDMGSAKIKNKFSLDIMANKYINLYKELTQKNDNN